MKYIAALGIRQLIDSKPAGATPSIVVAEGGRLVRRGQRQVMVTAIDGLSPVADQD